MRAHSTQDPSRLVPMGVAVLDSLPSDGGLYVPERLPRLPAEFWDDFADRPFADVAFDVARLFFDRDIDPAELRAIVASTLAFDAPLVPVADGISVLELFHGPTLAFKDFGARFMARVMARLRGSEELTVLVATSGDTGAAVAAGFHGVDGVRVFVLYPSGRVSPVQEKQLTTFGGNVTAVEVEGTFDDCQALVKKAFLDPELSKQCRLTSANSINISRLVPQTFYYLRAMQQRGAVRPAAFCVPSGNLGNLTAGLYARALGLGVHRFVAATNTNDAFVRYLEQRPLPTGGAVRTVSNAMDVAVPSNLERIDYAFGRDPAAAARVIEACAFDDDAAVEAMRRVEADRGYVLDPHTAVGWRAAEAFRARNPDVDVVLLATAHPAKFPETVERALGHPVELPPALAAAVAKPKEAVLMKVDFDGLRDLVASA